MPDLTIEYYACCAERFRAHTIKVPSSRPGAAYTVTISPSRETSCDCPAFKYSRHGTCKHIPLAEAKVCSWTAFVGPEVQEEEGKCPRCGGPTASEGWAV